MKSEGLACDGVRVRPSARHREVRGAREQGAFGKKGVRLPENGRRFGEFFAKGIRENSPEHDLKVVREGDHDCASPLHLAGERPGAGSERVRDRGKEFFGKDARCELLVGR